VGFLEKRHPHRSPAVESLRSPRHFPGEHYAHCVRDAFDPTVTAFDKKKVRHLPVAVVTNVNVLGRVVTLLRHHGVRLYFGHLERTVIRPRRFAMRFACSIRVIALSAARMLPGFRRRLRTNRVPAPTNVPNSASLVRK